MVRLVFICEPDEKGVLKVGERYINFKMYKDPLEIEFEIFICPVCSTHQVNNFFKCVLCGYDSKIIPPSQIDEFIEKIKRKSKI